MKYSLDTWLVDETDSVGVVIKLVQSCTPLNSEATYEGRSESS